MMLINFSDNVIYAHVNGLIITIIIYIAFALQMLQYKIRNNHKKSIGIPFYKIDNMLYEKENRKFIIHCIEEHSNILKYDYKIFNV